jgi:hypothetical protein
MKSSKGSASGKKRKQNKQGDKKENKIKRWCGKKLCIINKY